MKEYYNELHRIEFIITMACTGNCKHCNEGEHLSKNEHIQGEKVKDAIKDVAENYNIKSLMTFGGEPLLYPDDVCIIHKAAKEAGIATRQLITNGYFSKNEKRIKDVAHRLKESGVNCLLLSVDAFHQETIPLKPVRYFADCVREEAIYMELSPAWLVSETDDNPYNQKTREILKTFTDDGFKIGDGNIIWPQGNARKYLGEYFDNGKEYINPYEDDPYCIDTLCFDEKGNVLKGNIYERNILDIMEQYEVK